MEDVREQLEAVDQPRPRAREVGGGVDRHHAAADLRQVAAASPEVVVAMPCGYDAARAAEEAEAYASRLASLGARQVVAVSASAYFSRPGPRLVDGLELLAHLLHPERTREAPGVALDVELPAPAG